MPLLDPQPGQLTAKQAAHLLRRATFGPNAAHIRTFTGLTASEAVKRLLTPEPYLLSLTADLQTAMRLVFSNENSGALRSTLRYNWLHSMIAQPNTLLEKMTLFWQNHFVTTLSVVDDYRFMTHYMQLLRSRALGDYKSLVIEMSKNAAMIRYLDGRNNIVGRPNENYARELQELFTIGASQPNGTTNYTEDDVKAAARVLTGWSDGGYRSTTTVNVSVTFRDTQHDQTDKVFSGKYGNKTIKGRNGAFAGDEELRELVTMILDQPETARFMCRKFYRWLVGADITPQIEQEVIEPLAAVFRRKYDISQTLEVLLTSQHFFDEKLRGAIIKSPLEMILGAFRTFGLTVPNPETDRTGYNTLLASVHSQASNLQQSLFGQPSVFGWPAYYETNWYENWITSSTLALRNAFTNSLLAGINLGSGRRFTVDSIALARTVSDPENEEKIVTEWAQLLFPVDLKTEQVDFLIDEILLPGLPRYEWRLEWNAYQLNPNRANTDAIRIKLNNLLSYMLRMAEFHLL
jgi:uncharacterized protein (DUF1800 family)